MGTEETDKCRAVTKAALELIADQGFHGTPISQIAKKAGVGVGSIYRYFADKDELIHAIHKRLEEKMADMAAQLDPDRLEQEMVIIATRSDVDEELDRLEAHLDEIRRVLKSRESIGRRLDFLMQELNREANTLGSKSIAGITTQASVELKVLIEQMREQIQNIE